jgi:hypothetical protein
MHLDCFCHQTGHERVQSVKTSQIWFKWKPALSPFNIWCNLPVFQGESFQSIFILVINKLLLLTESN